MIPSISLQFQKGRAQLPDRSRRALIRMQPVRSAYARPTSSKAAPEQGFMYQYSIIDALMAGVFDGDLSDRTTQKEG